MKYKLESYQNVIRKTKNMDGHEHMLVNIESFLLK